MAALTVQSMTISGLVETYVAAAAGGDTFANDGKTFLRVKNGGGSSINVTLSSQVTDPAAGTAVADKVVAVANGVDAMIGPVNQKGFNSGGNVSVAYSGVTSVTVAAIKLTD